ncbi:hypothetical protein L249_3161 [Ophiocordyceps polyrhachis-furcata BCC 54312]|uniref:Uncharacterized protein n=1 Tax=Ophiocordyceps polyrhachis-furcata BCC 54312 TaxID=1330021 RepID=A0A367LPL7_9HYPO|nr:hypothetical protein L249_3161 [Ophiocordyceps polyrhachis-furcata BCC 54312]
MSLFLLLFTSAAIMNSSRHLQNSHDFPIPCRTCDEYESVPHFVHWQRFWLGLDLTLTTNPPSLLALPGPDNTASPPTTMPSAVIYEGNELSTFKQFVSTMEERLVPPKSENTPRLSAVIFEGNELSTFTQICLDHGGKTGPAQRMNQRPESSPIL